MKSFLVILSSAALVFGAAPNTGYFPGQPSCALPCLTSAISKADCPLSDIGCQCGTKFTEIETIIATCLIASCAPTALYSAQSAGMAVCSSFSAGLLSFTTPAPTTQPGGPVQNASSVSSAMTITPAPTASSSTDSGSGSAPATNKIETLAGLSSPTLSASQTTDIPSQPTGAAATPAMVGAGIMAGMLVAVAMM